MYIYMYSYCLPVFVSTRAWCFTGQCWKTKGIGIQTKNINTFVVFGLCFHIVEWKLRVSILTASLVHMHPLCRFEGMVVTFALQIARPLVRFWLCSGKVFQHRRWCKGFCSPASGADRNATMESPRSVEFWKRVQVAGWRMAG